MNQFTKGMLALPAVLAAAGAATYAVFAGWDAAEKWVDKHHVKLKPVSVPKDLGAEFPMWTAPAFNGRDIFAELVLTAPKASILRFTRNRGIMYLRTDGSGAAERKLLRKALHAALTEVAKAGPPRGPEFK